MAHLNIGLKDIRKVGWRFTKPARLDKTARPHALFTVAGFFLRLGITALAVSRPIHVTGQPKGAE
jgi:hypothetical protein